MQSIKDKISINYVNK